MTVTKQQVIAALAEQRVNRPRALADANIRSLLRRYGGGASNIAELKPEFYPAVYAAAGGSMFFEEFYGVVVDVPAIDATNPAAIDVSPPAPRRIRSPLTADLEAQLAARASRPRQFAKGRVDTGNASRPGDRADDTPFNAPAGEKMS